MFIIIISFLSSFDYVRMAAFENNSRDEKMETFYRIVFTFDILINFFTEQHLVNGKGTERQWKKIAVMYVQGRLALDIFAIIPF